MTKRILSETAIIIFVSVSLSLGVNGFRSHGIRLFNSSETELTDITAITEMVKEISVEEAIMIFEHGEVLFVDLRSPNDYSKQHIRGALNLPGYKFDNWINDFISETDPYTHIVTYCDGADCDLSVNLAQKLYWAGFENISYLKGGLSRMEKHLFTFREISDSL